MRSLKGRTSRLEAKAPAASQNIIFLGLLGQPDPRLTDVGPDDIVVRISFVGSRDERFVEEGHAARH